MERLIGEYLFLHPDRISHREIVHAFQVSKNTVTKALDGFEKAGILIRTSRVGGWRLSDEYAEVSNPKKWDDSPNNWDSNPKNWDSSPKNWDSKPQREEETETEQESKKERSKERSKEKEREKEGVRDIGNPNGIPLSETIVSDVAYTREGDPLSDSELLAATGGEESAPCPYQAIQNMFNRICVSYPHIKGIDGKRRQLVSGRWTSYPNLDVFREVFENAENSSFMKGQSKSGWTADFDWMMKPSNFQKVLEGNYNDRVQNYGYGAVPDKDPFVAYLDAVIAGDA